MHSGAGRTDRGDDGAWHDDDDGPGDDYSDNDDTDGDDTGGHRPGDGA